MHEPENRLRNINDGLRTRYRLRKKLGLDKDEALEASIARTMDGQSWGNR